MATGDYCTVSELKAELWPTGTVPDDVEDATLLNVIASVSRWIDNYTGTRFYTTAADESRYYSPKDSTILFTDDIISVTTLQTDEDGDRTYETTWETTDYDLLPENASLNSQPYRWIENTPQGNYLFPCMRKSVKITGKFGWSAASSQPGAIKRACIIQCLRIFKRKDTPFGMLSNPLGGDMRLITDLDPDVKGLLDVYRRYV